MSTQEDNEEISLRQIITVVFEGEKVDNALALAQEQFRAVCEEEAQLNTLLTQHLEAQGFDLQQQELSDEEFERLIACEQSFQSEERFQNRQAYRKAADTLKAAALAWVRLYGSKQEAEMLEEACKLPYREPELLKAMLKIKAQGAIESSAAS